MRPVFTIHAGEFLFGEEVEQRVPNAELWIPAKDRGIDFLITKPGIDRPISVQVKMSRDYKPNLAVSDFEKGLMAGGWFVFSHDKLWNSPADIWSLILVSRDRSTKPVFINLAPKTLLEKLQAIHGDSKKYHLYPWFIKSGNQKLCIEGRGLKKAQKEELIKGNLNLGPRDLSRFLNDWSLFI